MKFDLKDDDHWEMALNSFDRRRSERLAAEAGPSYGHRSRTKTHTIVSVELTNEQVAKLDRAKGVGTRSDYLRSVLLPELEKLP